MCVWYSKLYFNTVAWSNVLLKYSRSLSLLRHFIFRPVCFSTNALNTLNFSSISSQDFRKRFMVNKCYKIPRSFLWDFIHWFTYVCMHQSQHSARTNFEFSLEMSLRISHTLHRLHIHDISNHCKLLLSLNHSPDFYYNLWEQHARRHLTKRRDIRLRYSDPTHSFRQRVWEPHHNIRLLFQLEQFLRAMGSIRYDPHCVGFHTQIYIIYKVIYLISLM